MVHVNGNWRNPSVSGHQLGAWIQAVLDSEHHPNAEVSVTFVQEEEMAALNLRYTGRDGTTDVLAFSQQEGEYPAPEPDLLGDVIIDADRVIEQAQEYHVDATEELLRVIAHGVLHLVGYDHSNSQEERIMRESEESHIRRFGTQTGVIA